MCSTTRAMSHVGAVGGSDTRLHELAATTAASIVDVVVTVRPVKLGALGRGDTSPMRTRHVWSDDPSAPSSTVVDIPVRLSLQDDA